MRNEVLKQSHSTLYYPVDPTSRHDAYVGGTYDGTNFSAPTPPADTRTYAEKRAHEYPPIADQLDMLWHAIDDNATLKTRYADFHTAIKTVKDANPK